MKRKMAISYFMETYRDNFNGISMPPITHYDNNYAIVLENILHWPLRGVRFLQLAQHPSHFVEIFKYIFKASWP